MGSCSIHRVVPCLLPDLHACEPTIGSATGGGGQAAIEVAIKPMATNALMAFSLEGQRVL